MLSDTVKLPPQIAEEVARAFAHTFTWAVALIMLAFIPTLFLPSHGPNTAMGSAVDGEEGVLVEPIVGIVE